jgi:class 3 adenylate cyclase
LAVEDVRSTDLPSPSLTPNPLSYTPRSYTPKHLAQKILNTRAALEGERKQVTVLFADVQRSLELAEQVDAEEWHDIMDRFFEILTDGVHRFEGTVNQYTGDGIMALFGAPIAHEDHAQRACYTALHLSEALRDYAAELRRTRGLNFSVRMGLNSGEVVVGKIGDDLRMDYTAQGHTVGLAQRMESLAAADQIYLTDQTARLVSGYFALHDLGDFQIKGVREPVRVNELRGVGELRTRMDVSRARGLSRFVGRTAEIQALDRALEEVLAGEGRIVSVVGEAGVGKSRLCYEFTCRCRERSIPVYEAHALPYGKSVPLLPLLDLLRSYFGITEQDSDRSARDKIAGRTLLGDPGLNDALPLMFEVLGVPDPARPTPPAGPEERRRQFLQVLMRLIATRGDEEPAVFLIEDLHWLDEASEAFLRSLAGFVPHSGTLVITNFRPEYQAKWMQEANHRSVRLQPLGPEATAELLRNLIGEGDELPQLAQRIHERTAGNPFFAEEVVRALLEQGILATDEGARAAGGRGGHQGPRRLRLTEKFEAIEIPPSVQSVLAARIDRLPAREKALLETASVIGKQFSRGILSRVGEEALPDLVMEGGLDAALAALVAGDFLYERVLYPEPEYAFHHPLTQEVAYQSQLNARRVGVHAAVARAVETLSGERLNERAAVIAHHWGAAGDSDAAARWHARAAEWSELSDFREALRHWHRVRELLAPLAEASERVELRLTACIRALNVGWRLGMEAADADALYAEGKDLALRSGNTPAAAEIENNYRALGFFTGRASVDTMLQDVREGGEERLVEDEPRVRIGLVAGQMVASVSAGRLREAMSLSEEGMKLLLGHPELELEEMAVVLRGFRVLALSQLGRLEDAEREADAVLKLAKENGQAELLGFAHGWCSQVAQAKGDARGAMTHALSSLEMSGRVESPFSRVIGLLNLAGAQLLAGEPETAVQTAQEGVAIVREHHVGVQIEAYLLLHTAQAHLRLGHVSEARGAIEESIAVIRKVGEILHEGRAIVVLAEIILRDDGEAGRAKVESLLEEAARHEQEGLKSIGPAIRLLRAELAHLAGDDELRWREVREALRLSLEMGAAGHAEALERKLAEAVASERP